MPPQDVPPGADRLEGSPEFQRQLVIGRGIGQLNRLVFFGRPSLVTTKVLTAGPVLSLTLVLVGARDRSLPLGNRVAIPPLLLVRAEVGGRCRVAT